MRIYLAGFTPQYQVIEELLVEQGHVLVGDVSSAEIVALVPTEGGISHPDTISAVAEASKQGKPWTVIFLQLKNFFENYRSTTRRRITLERKIK